jgi:hypothetical protein
MTAGVRDRLALACRQPALLPPQLPVSCRAATAAASGCGRRRVPTASKHDVRQRTRGAVDPDSSRSGQRMVGLEHRGERCRHRTESRRSKSMATASAGRRGCGWRISLTVSMAPGHGAWQGSTGLWANSCAILQAGDLLAADLQGDVDIRLDEFVPGGKPGRRSGPVCFGRVSP